jgi:6-phosphogluconolactonase/glucosamine-6-phosphate isomerase/deaminase
MQHMKTAGIFEFHNIPDRQAAVAVLTKRLLKELSTKKRVLWLVSGGSNIAITVAVMNALPPEAQSYLAIMLSDERFGPFGHADSNLQQLHDAGFTPGQATVVPVLTPNDSSLEGTTERYEAAIATAFQNADSIIAQLGIGADGHVAGILPGSPAAMARKLVVGYRTEKFARITLTFSALKKVSAAYAFVFGSDKREQLQQLQDTELPLTIQPAQILKQIIESYVYNDQIGGKT